jgi:transcription elongation factor S-II
VLHVLVSPFVVPLTATLFQETKAGLAVGKLRTHGSKNIADLAKELVKKWKGEVDRAKAAAGSGVKDSNGSTRAPPLSFRMGCLLTPCLVQLQGVHRASSTQSPGPISPSTSTSVRTAKSDGVPTNVLGDHVRDKCMEMLYDALAFDSGARKSRSNAAGYLWMLTLYQPMTN